MRLSRRILRSAGVQMPGGQADGLSCALFARTLLVVPEACDFALFPGSSTTEVLREHPDGYPKACALGERQMSTDVGVGGESLDRLECGVHERPFGRLRMPVFFRHAAGRHPCAGQRVSADAEK